MWEVPGSIPGFQGLLLKNNFVLEFVSYFITTKKYKNYHFFVNKDLLVSTIKLWFATWLSSTVVRAED